MRLMTAGVQLLMYRPWFTGTEKHLRYRSCFYKKPVDRRKEVLPEYLINAQGEDVVAGIRTPDFIDTLGDKIPEAYNQLVDICQKLEAHFKDMQDIEFTIQEGKLYMLRPGLGNAQLPQPLDSKGYGRRRAN